MKLGTGPYRSGEATEVEEGELWSRLDCALEASLRDPVHAWGIAWTVAVDSGRFAEVNAAATWLLSVLGELI